MYDDRNIEEMVAMLAILSQINHVIETFYLDNESDIKKQNCELRKRILGFLHDCNTKPEFIKGMKVVLLKKRIS